MQCIKSKNKDILSLSYLVKLFRHSFGEIVCLFFSFTLISFTITKIKSMKTRKLLVVAALLTFTIIACKEEETKFGASISPIQNVVNSLPSFGYFRDEPTVFGTQFRSSKDGRITELGIRAGKGTYSVSLWDSSAQNIITSTTITASDSTVFVYKDITDLAITANKVYIVSMNNQITGRLQKTGRRKLFVTKIQ